MTLLYLYEQSSKRMVVRRAWDDYSKRAEVESRSRYKETYFAMEDRRLEMRERRRAQAIVDRHRRMPVPARPVARLGWKDLDLDYGECPECGGVLEVLTKAPPGEYHDGDPVRCPDPACNYAVTIHRSDCDDDLPRFLDDPD